jgi:PAS domain S-box-containing protein
MGNLDAQARRQRVDCSRDARLMVTLGEIVRWCVYTLSSLYNRVAARLLGRDRLLSGSERKFRALLEAAPDAMVIVDWHGHIALINAQAERLFGYPREEIIGQNVTELIPQRFRAPHREHQKTYMRDAQARPMGRELELYGRRKDGTEFPVEISLGPLATNEGMLVSSAIRDVTERKRIEAELADRAEALARSNADLEQFAYVASHDLQTPLRAVAGFVDLLRRRYAGRLDDDADEFIELAVGGVERMQRLIDDLLAYSRVRREEARRDPVDCNAAMRDVLAALRAEIERTGAQVQVADLPTVLGARSQVDQLFQNLVGNALKFSNSRPPRVEVSAAREDGRWRISVRDNGIGIDPADADRMFRMFERLPAADDFPGTGIGLAICQRIVEAHGGEIHAAPAPGGGTVMSFTLADSDGS